MIDLKLYIVNYTTVIKGGLANTLLFKMPDYSSAFADESDMLKEVIKLKKDDCVENIRVYVNKYELESCEKYEF